MQAFELQHDDYQQLQDLLSHAPDRSHVIERMHYLCSAFLARPYVGVCVGEGPAGIYYQKPICRTDCFDCMSYMNIILALIHAEDINDFIQRYLSIQYRGNIHYLNRNYFFESDWLGHNRLNHHTDNATVALADKLSVSVHLAETCIDVPAWIRNHQLSDIYLLNDDPDVATERLKHLHAQASLYHPIPNRLDYVHLEDLLEKNNQLSAWEDPMVAVVVRPSWDIRHRIGTHLNVSHVGFWLPNGASGCFFHASSYLKQVVCQEFNEYLQFCQEIDGIDGFHFERVNSVVAC